MKRTVNELNSVNQLITYQLALNILPFDDKISDFIAYALRQINGVETCRVCLIFTNKPYGDLEHALCEKCDFYQNNVKPRSVRNCLLYNVEGLSVVPVQTLNKQFGYIVLQMAPDFNTNLIAAISNFANVVAVNIENKLQRNTLEEQNKELFDYKNHLQQLIEKRTQALENKNTELKKLNDDMTRFFSILSHDLRSPFNSLLGFSELLMANLRNQDMDKTEQQLQLMAGNLKRTYNLLNDLLLWSKTLSKNIAFSPQCCNFLSVCTEIIDEKQDQAQMKAISIRGFAGQNLFVEADKNMLKTVLRNLISNAIKFTHKGGHINVFADHNGQFAVITVSDNGVGITEADQNKLWNFAQPHTTQGTDKEKGTGLGLVLCKEFIEKHGGKIWVESKVGHGSDFKFTLPLCTQV